MKRLARILLNATTVLLLLLCTATMALWVRSCYTTDYLALSRGIGGRLFESSDGAIVVFECDSIDSATGQYSISGPPRWLVPYWFLALLCFLPSVAWIINWFRRQRLPRAGLCPDCGYDIRATPQRCPECGRKLNLQSALGN